MVFLCVCGCCQQSPRLYQSARHGHCPPNVARKRPSLPRGEGYTCGVSLFKSASTVSLWTLVSRVTGLARELLIAATFGASAMTERAELKNIEQIQYLDKTVSLVVNDTFKGQPGIDFFDGGLGQDTLVYSGPIERYNIQKSGNRYVVSEPTGSDDTDYLSNIERLQFSNGKLALDLDGNAGDAARLIGTLLGPSYVKDKALAGLVIGLLDQNYSSEAIASMGLGTSMYLGLAGSASNDLNFSSPKPIKIAKPPSVKPNKFGSTAML